MYCAKGVANSGLTCCSSAGICGRRGGKGGTGAGPVSLGKPPSSRGKKKKKKKKGGTQTHLARLAPARLLEPLGEPHPRLVDVCDGVRARALARAELGERRLVAGGLLWVDDVDLFVGG